MRRRQVRIGILVAQSGGNGMIVTEGGRWAGYARCPSLLIHARARGAGANPRRGAADLFLSFALLDGGGGRGVGS